MTEPLPRCPVCATALDGEPVLCPTCAAPHHPECWDYAGGCAIFGCRGAPRPFPCPTSELPVLASAVVAWRKANDIQWGMFRITHLSLTLGLASLPLMLAARAAATPQLEGVARDMGVACMSVGVLSAVACLTAAPVTLLARSTLHARLGMSLEPPEQAGRELLDRLRSERLGQALRNARRAFAFLVLACLGSMAVELHRGHEVQILPCALALFLGGLLPLCACGAARAGEAYMTALQNRLAASLKDRPSTAAPTRPEV